MELTKHEKKHPLGIKQIKRLMAGPVSVQRTKEKPAIVVTKGDALSSDVDKFLKNGGHIKGVQNNKRSVPYWAWSLEEYPTRKYRR